MEFVIGWAAVLPDLRLHFILDGLQFGIGDVRICVLDLVSFSGMACLPLLSSECTHRYRMQALEEMSQSPGSLSQLSEGRAIDCIKYPKLILLCWRGRPIDPRCRNSLPHSHASEEVARHEASDVDDGSVKISSLGQLEVSANTCGYPFSEAIPRTLR